MGKRFERNGEKKMKQLYELSRKFPKDWIKKAPKGKFGNYVPHPVITQRLLEVCGPFDWEVVESPRRLLKSYTFASPEHRKRFLIEFMEEQDQMHHHARMTIDENEIHVEIYTRDLNTITESDHHLARLADLIFTDTAR